MSSAKKFWEEGTGTLLHLCDIPEEVFYARHKHALALIPKYGREFIGWRYQSSNKFIGLLIAGKYYFNVWGSRSCSGYLAHLVGIPDDNSGAYINLYCGSSDYYAISTGEDLPKKYKNIVKRLVEDFKKADEQDNRVW